MNRDTRIRGPPDMDRVVVGIMHTNKTHEKGHPMKRR